MIDRIALKPYFALFFVFFMVALSTGCTEQPRGDSLVVSIRPLALITREISGDDFPLTVLAGNSDPHHYAPTVADRAQLESAALIVWMGPRLEFALARQLQQPAERKLELLAADGYEYSGANPQDPHLWLRPRNAARMAAQIAERLIQLKPQNAAQYRQRARDFSSRMANLQKVLDRALWAYKDTPVVTTHAAYGHFFGPAGMTLNSLSNTDNDPHGAKTLLQLTTKADGCLFGEAPTNGRDQQTAEHLGLRYQALDLLGQQLPAAATYQQFIEQLLADSRNCLGKVSDQSAPGAEP